MRQPADLMRSAIVEGERARGITGDNPWVGCVISDERGEILASGHTQGPGEDHAEIVAFEACLEAGIPLEHATLYSTLEPCSFHGRTPACARVIVNRGVRRVIIGIRDPNPRVDGEGIRILRDAGIEVIEGVCAAEITRSLADWMFLYHPHEPLRRARSLLGECGGSASAAVDRVRDLYGIDRERAEALVLCALEPLR